MFLSCRPFVVVTTLSTGLVAVEVTSVSWLGQLKGLQDRNINMLDGTTVENKGKLILTEIFPSVQKHEFFSIDIYPFKFVEPLPPMKSCLSPPSK